MFSQLTLILKILRRHAHQFLGQIMLAILSGMLLQAFSVEVWAHNPNIHALLVRDAIDFIKVQGTPRQQESLQRMSLAAGGEAKLRAILAGEAKRTDFYRDLFFYSNSWMVDIFKDNPLTEYDDNYFTRLNHFLNSGRPVDLWRNQDGYYYHWSSKKGYDHLAMSGYRVSLADLEVDNEYSLSLERYRTHFRGNINQWDRNWTFEWDSDDDWDIENTRFAPLNSLAYYWYRRYVNFPHEPARTTLDGAPAENNLGRIAGLSLLGPALHACGDVTVPQHILGAMGYGHQSYENEFEAFYIESEISRNDSAVKEHLQNRDFLRLGQNSVQDQVETLQLTLVTGDMNDAGTDGKVFFDIGPRNWNLDTGMDDLERGNDDVFTLDASGLRVQDFQQIQIRFDGGGSKWYLKAAYIVVNGVLLYGDDHINKWLNKKGDEWTANDFQPRVSLGKQIWPIDTVMEKAASYVMSYSQTQTGVSNLRSDSYWDNVFFSSGNYTRRVELMNNLLNLAVALIVRTIEMAHLERRVIFSAQILPLNVNDSRPYSVFTSPSARLRSLTTYLSPGLSAKLPPAQKQSLEQSLGRIHDTLSTQRTRPVSNITARLMQEEAIMMDILGPSLEIRPRPQRRKISEPKPRPDHPLPQSRASAAESSSAFRLPTAAEVRDPQRLEQYHRVAIEYAMLRQLTSATIARAIGRAALPRIADSVERSRIEKRLRVMEVERSRLLGELSGRAGR